MIPGWAWGGGYLATELWTVTCHLCLQLIKSHWAYGFLGGRDPAASLCCCNCLHWWGQGQQLIPCSWNIPCEVTGWWTLVLAVITAVLPVLHHLQSWGSLGLSESERNLKPTLVMPDWSNTVLGPFIAWSAETVMSLLITASGSTRIHTLCYMKST